MLIIDDGRRQREAMIQIKDDDECRKNQGDDGAR